MTEFTSLETLERDLGGEAAGDIVRTFLETLPERLGEIANAQQAGDVELARRPAHTLRSGAQLVGAIELAEAAARIEQGDLEVALGEVAAQAAAQLRSWIRHQLTR